MRAATGFAVILLATLVGCNRGATSSAPPKTAAALAAAIEKGLSGAAAYQCDLTTAIQLATGGARNQLEAKYAVAVRQPDRWNITLKSGDLGATSVNDGVHLTTHLPMMRTYIVEDAPARDEIFDPAAAEPQMMLLGPINFGPTFLGRGFAKLFTDGATKSTLDQTDVDGKTLLHATFIKGTSKWELWATPEDPPELRQIVVTPDMSGDDSAMKALAPVFKLEFANWNMKADLADDAFVFVPPSGLRKANSLMEALSGGPRGPEPPHPLVGEPAGEFELETLDGGKFRLEDVLGKKPVMLDFWATWCGPCVRALPSVTAAAKEMGDDVVFFAVDLREDEEKIRAFFDESGLEFPVLLDRSGEVAQRFQVSGIPHTVLIGLDARIQAVHVGYSGDARKKLVTELTALLDGKDLAAETLADFEKSSQSREPEDDAIASDDGDEEASSKRLKPAWSFKGKFTAVAVDPTEGAVYGLKDDDKVQRFDAQGAATGEITLEVPGRLLRLAQLDEDDARELLLFKPWGGNLAALDDAGQSLWEVPGEQGIDDVAAADLDGDGLDEVIVGYNGFTGLLVFNHDGTQRWKNADIGNVWHVTAGRFTTADAVQVISTSAEGKVHVFAADGSPVNAFDPQIYANGVSFAPGADGRAGRVIVTGTEGTTSAGMRALDGNGDVVWSAALPTGEAPHVMSQAVDARGEFAVAALMGGLVHIIDLADGKIVATFEQQGTMPDVALLAQDDGPTLALVATHSKLSAFVVPEGAADDDEAESAH